MRVVRDSSFDDERMEQYFVGVETSTEYCLQGGFGPRCPSCPGHEMSFRVYEIPVGEQKKGQYRRPNPSERCAAMTLTTGKRCLHFADPDDPDQLCSKHIEVQEHAKAGKYEARQETEQQFYEQFTEKSTNESGPE